NAWGRTLASVYSVRPQPRATVSTPVTWREIEAGLAIEDFRIDNVPDPVARLGDLFAPLVQARGRFRLDRLSSSLRRVSRRGRATGVRPSAALVAPSSSAPTDLS